MCIVQESFGKRGRHVTLDEIRKDAEKLREGLDKSSKMNEGLKQLMATHVENLTLMSGSLQELQEKIPSLAQLQCTMRFHVTITVFSRTSLLLKLHVAAMLRSC